MKSIVQEASSIAKAIEQGLIKAGNPRDFAVKILEYPEKNFFGMTTKPAKIALYCDERTRKPHEPYSTAPSPEQQPGRSTRGNERQRERTPNTRDQHRDNRDSRESRDSRDNRDNRESRDNRDNRDNRESNRNAASDQSRSERPARTSYATNRPQQPTEPATSYQQNNEAPSYEQQKTYAPITSCWSPETVVNTKEWLTHVLSAMNRPVSFSIDIDNLYLRITLDQPLFNDPEHERKVLASLSLLLIETTKHLFRLNLRGHKVLLTHRS